MAGFLDTVIEALCIEMDDSRKLMGNLNIVSIATNKYLDYWKNQARSIDNHLAPDTTCTLFLYTDQPLDARIFAKGLNRIQVEIFSIPSYGWPDATLLRYRLILDKSQTWAGDEILVYLDADMLAVSSISYKDFNQNEQLGVTLVHHPGFYRPLGYSKIKFYLAHPKVAIQDLFTRVASGGLGAWESRSSSTAFVKRKHRKGYFCGGIWWGTASEIVSLCESLVSRIDLDSARNVLAIWHDESHLNWWATTHPHQTASPAYCFVSQYPALDTLSPKIVAVDKRIAFPD
jgi:hypothetical protein